MAVILRQFPKTWATTVLQNAIKLLLNADSSVTSTLTSNFQSAIFNDLLEMISMNHGAGFLIKKKKNQRFFSQYA